MPMHNADSAHSPDAHATWHALLKRAEVQTLIDLALLEDIGSGDLTSTAVFTTPQGMSAELVARTATTVCGLPLAAHLFTRLDAACQFEAYVQEGSQVTANTALGRVTGPVAAILSAERCVLNFVMRLCGVATATARAVAEVPSHCRAQVFDTHKTLPGWRLFDKAAVAAGGGANHRMGLHDAVMLKDNHIAAAGSITAAMKRVREAVKGANCSFVEVEIDRLDQLDEAIASGPDIIMLDNFSDDLMREAVERVTREAPAIELEASGGITTDRIAAVAETGVHRISLGALTHTVTPADIALDFLDEG